MLTHFLDLLVKSRSILYRRVFHYQYTKTKSHIRNLFASWLRIPNSFGYFENSIGTNLE